jgi:transcriptional regulator with XRE-family HTH domain
MEFKVALGHTIRLKRLEQNKTMRDMRKVCRYVSPSYLSEVERGMNNVSSELLETIAESLGVEVYELIRDTANLMENFDKLSPSDFQREYTDLRR